jgi:hypothetical protein
LTATTRLGILRGMVEQVKERAEGRLLEAFAHQGIEDNRPVYRERLRGLRERSPDAFERALRHYEEAVLPALADGPDPIEVWIGYGVWLAELEGPGRLVEVDADGRARPAQAASADGLVLFLPEDERGRALPARLPATPSPAQRATYDLLVTGLLESSR